MASEEAVALALRELSTSMSPRDQEGLANFLTEYFGSAEMDESGTVEMNKLYNHNKVLE